MNEPTRHIVVLIPARDEEQLLPRCLDSIAAARKNLPAGVTSDVIVISDCSKDQTTHVARDLLQSAGSVVCSMSGRVGAARKLGGRVALERYAGRPEECWIANTDADCIVPPDWLAKQIAIADLGFAAVAGIVDVDSFLEHDSGVPELFRRTYAIHADGTHPHVHGANLGVRADAYLKVGGWSEIATGEDHDLWERLCGSALSLLSTAGLKVTTSGRRVGRAPSGFAERLGAHNGTAA